MELPLAARTCPACAKDVGFPNVRFAQRAEEVDALALRLNDAHLDAAIREADNELTAFQQAVRESEAVMNRRFAALQAWIRSDNPTFKNFYSDIENGRPYTQDVWNKQRISAENTISPHFFDDLIVAALTLDGTGLDSYGSYSVTLRDDAIDYRATVFEENPFFFNKKRGIVSGDDPPVGFRATWAKRDELAAAKLHLKVRPGDGRSAFPSILMGDNRDDPACDFIEVHVYEPIHRAAIKSVSGARPTDPLDQMLWEDVKNRVSQAGAKVTEI